MIAQLRRAGDVAGETLAYPDGDRRRRLIQCILLHHVEMVIEGRHLVDFRLRHAHFLREGGKMRRAQPSVTILDEVQVLDKQVAAARRAPQQRLHFGQCGRVDTPPLGRLPFTFPAGIRRRDGNGPSVHAGNPCLMCANRCTLAHVE